LYSLMLDLVAWLYNLMAELTIRLPGSIALFHIKPRRDAGPPGPSNERLYVKPDLVVGV
jgi:hypothetical protein